MMLEALLHFGAANLDEQNNLETAPKAVEKKETKKVTPPKNGETIIVKTRKISKPFANIVFRQMDIYTNPASKADVLLAVSDLQFATNNNNSAEVILRGGSPKLTRTYFNDVPIYEIVRGASQLQVSRGFSIFNTATIDGVETYASSPPAYFANTAGGVIRIMPQDTISEGGELQVNLTKLSLSYGVANKGPKRGYFQIYSDLSSLGPLISVNPDIGKRVQYEHGFDVGSNIFYALDDKNQIRLLNIYETEDAKYQYDLFKQDNFLGLKRNRNYNLFSFEHDFGQNRVKLDLAKTFINQSVDIDNNNYRNENQYDYADINLAGKFSKAPISYRFGINYENFDLFTRAAIIRPEINFAINADAQQTKDYGSIYGFATYNQSEYASYALGIRKYWKNSLDLDDSLQFSAAFKAKSKKHNFIISYGEYGAVVLPNRSAFDGISKGSSQSVSLDYKYKSGSNNFGFGLYNKKENLDGRETTINGFDGSFGFMFNPKTEISGTFARSIPYFYKNNEKQNGENKLDYLFKVKAKIVTAPSNYVNFIFTSMSGQAYSNPIGASQDINGEIIKIYGKLNDRKLKPYQSLDFNYIFSAKFWPNEKKPIMYLNVNNILNHTNEAGVEYNQDLSQSKIRTYVKRTWVIGAIFSF